LSTGKNYKSLKWRKLQAMMGQKNGFYRVEGWGDPVFSGQLSVIGGQERPAPLVLVHTLIVRRWRVIICKAHAVGRTPSAK
jgi:hypothetical protein